MSVHLQACFDIDLPSPLHKMLQEMVKPNENGTYIIHTSPRAFAKEHPALIPYLVKNGWMSSEAIVLIVNGGKDEEVDEPVAQQTNLSGIVTGDFGSDDDAS